LFVLIDRIECFVISISLMKEKSVLEEWEEGGSSAFSGSHACLTWWGKSCLISPVILHCWH